MNDSQPQIMILNTAVGILVEIRHLKYSESSSTLPDKDSSFEEIEQ